MINFWTVKVIRFVTIFFVVAIIIASYFYPGGNIHDPAQLGYSFTHNFLSDLGGLESHSGEDNIISSVFFNDTATTEIYTRSLVGSVRCV